MEEYHTCYICDKHFPNLKGLSVHISKTHKIAPKDYYDAHHRKEKEGCCSICNDNTFFDGLSMGYRKTCSKKCTLLLDSSERNPKKNPQKRPSQICHECGKSCNGLKGLASHIKVHNLSSKDYYDKYLLEDESERLCYECEKESNFLGFGKGYSPFCSCECRGNSDDMKELMSKVLLKTYEKNGDDIRERRRKTNMERHGVENPSQSEIFRQKKKQTCLKNYGVEYFTQSKEGKEILSRNTTKRLLKGEFNHPTCFVSGYFYSHKNQIDLYYRSSYELRAYEILESDDSVLSYKSEPITIPYKDENGVGRRYIPDILIFSNNSKHKLIEIKPKKLLSNIRNQLKIESAKKYCETNNLYFEVWTEQELSL